MLFPLFDRNPTRRIPWLTMLLIAVNLGIAFWMHGMGEEQTLDLLYEHGLVPKRLSQIDAAQPTEIVQEIKQGVGENAQVIGTYRTKLENDRWSVYSSLITMMFLHGGWLHVISNMWMLWIFGNNVEDRLGHLVFAGYYLMGGILASYCQWITDPMSQIPVVGASGAVWAVLGGYAVTYPKAKVKTLMFIGVPLLLDLPALLVIGVWFAFDLALGLINLQGFMAQTIAHWAHVGGCVAGIILMPLLAIGSSPPEADWRSETDAMLDSNPKLAARSKPEMQLDFDETA